jgi:hypothetical protein
MCAEELRRFKVCGCPSCGVVRVTEAKSVLRCLRCGKSSKFRVRNQPHVKIWGSFDYAADATKVVQALALNTKTKHDRSL